MIDLGAPPPISPTSSAGSRPGRADERLRRALYSGIWRPGDWRGVRAAILDGADVDLRIAHGQTVLMRAARNARHFELRFLLAHGADPDLQDDVGRTALMHACWHDRRPDGVWILLDHGARADLTDQRGWSALQWAAHENRDLRLVHGLLQRAVAISVADVDFYAAGGREDVLSLFDEALTTGGREANRSCLLAALGAQRSGSLLPRAWARQARSAISAGWRRVMP